VQKLKTLDWISVEVMIPQPPPAIAPLPADGKPRPFWSVMIPAYNPSKNYLEQALRSVLYQAPAENQMQIEVVDDCSPEVDVQGMVKSIAGKRIAFSRTPRNLGLAGCWNTCLERSRGQWVHILHQDDYVLPGFYQMLAKKAECHPEANLLATRSFFVDNEGIISTITERVIELEAGGHCVDRFFYHTPIQCPGVMVKRAFYESSGGFLPSLVSGLDCEMWVRVIGLGGGVVTPETLACYRSYPGNETGRLARTAQILYDTVEMNRLFAQRYPAFDTGKARQRVLNVALGLIDHFTLTGDAQAVKKNLDFWKANAPLKIRLRRWVGRLVRKYFA
jgi:glycosyltransferase involved in cell wall biosynthesis